MNHITNPANRIGAIALLLCLLLPIFAGAVSAAPIDPQPPVWSGGISESFTGNGTQSKPYLINSPEDLALLANRVRNGERFAGKHFQLNEDIRINDISSSEDWKESPPLRTWTPIGGYTAFTVESAEAFEQAIQQYGILYTRSGGNYQPAATYSATAVYYQSTTFDGVFDGNGHSIIGLYISGDEPQVGLFGALGNATVRNLRLTSAFVDGSKQIGILAGSVHVTKSAEIHSVRIEGQLRATDCGGGIIGSVETTGSGKLSLTDCDFQGTLQGNSNIGGIAGKTVGDSGAVVLSSCTSQATIHASSHVGGIVGNLTGANNQLNSCKNNSSIQGDSYIGGIVGTLEPSIGSAVLENCQNGGTIFTIHTSGGIAGAIHTTADGSLVEILNCRNIGEIHTNEFAGGIVGSVQLSGAESALQLHDSKNSALIQGNRSLGGILGNAMVHQGVLSLYNCENYGNITARNDYAGGILGEAISYGEIKLSHNSVRAAIQSDSFAGGIAGTLIAESGSILVEQSAAAGTVQAATAVGGCIGEVNAKGEGSTVQLFNCLAINTLSASESLGGITSHLYAEHGNASIHTSIFGGGIITGCKLTGGIAADLYASSNSASVLIETCFFTQNSASVVAHPRGGDGKETIQSSESRTEDTLRSHEQLKGLDQTIWKPDANTAHIMTPGDLPVIWEEYKYTITQNGVILEAYLGRSDIVRVPDRLGGMYVSTVAEAAFWQSHVIRVILPDSVTAIGEAAFAGCKNLERITLPASLISIGTRAFSGCEALCERRFTGSISSVLVGSENTPFQELPITRPLTIPIQHLYEDTSTAGKTTALTCYAGDFYQVTPLSIRGYKAEEGALQGIALTTDRITVVYRIGTYHLTILYQYPDGTEASPSFEGDFRFGEKYRVSSPILEGYKAEYTLIEGTMDGEDTLIIVHYTEIYENDSANGQYTLHIILFILAGLLFVCCLCYFVYRYRSITEQARLENETE